MWDAQGYGNQGAGGFFNSPSQGPSSTEKQAKPARRVQNLVPLTVRTVLGATDAGLQFGGEEVHMFTVVGLVRKVEVTSTKITYLIDDGTGGISALFWIESSDGEEDQTIPPIMEDTYCRVFGSLRMQQGKPYIFVFRIVPLENLNELTRHLLEVVHAKLKMEKIESKEQQVTPMNVTRPTGTNELSNSMMETGVGQLPNFTPQQTMVYNIIRQSTLDIGTGKEELMKSLTGKISPKQIDIILDFLSNEGHIYSTIDEDHYRCTD